MRDEVGSGEGRPTLRVLASEMEPPAAPEQPPGGGEGGADPGGGGDKVARKPGDIFDGSPVLALGVHGKAYYYLDVLGQLAEIDNHTKDRMRAVYGGATHLLQQQFPSFNKSGGISGWSQEHTAAAMVRACTEKGVWNAFERVRGPGAWADEDGGVVLHCGSRVLHRGAWVRPGERDGYVYPSAPALPAPLPRSELDFSPGVELLELLQTWRWSRGDLDAYLLMGWITAAIFGGALSWRPLVWITGDAGTGKSTVQLVMRHVMGGEGALLQSSDASEAAIRQLVAYSTIPVLLDEIEAEADNRKVNAVVKLARQAASGGVVVRGSADHKAVEFRARSAFAFSSIYVPPMMPQDLSRLALLELQPLPRDVTPPKIDQRRLGRVGRALRTRVMAQWDRLHETLELYRQALSLAGHGARGADQFGALLAMADMVMHDDLPDAARCSGWANKLSASAISEQMDQAPSWEMWINRLLGQHLDVHRSGRKVSVARWVLAAAELTPKEDEDAPRSGEAKNVLPDFGLRVEGRGKNAELWIANAHPQLDLLHRDTHWFGGAWAQAAKRIPGAVSCGSQRWGGLKSRGWKIPLRSISWLYVEDEDPPVDPDPLDDMEDFS